MNFLHPQGLWLFLLAVPLVALHFYRGRLWKLSVPALALWEQVLLEEQKKSAFRKLRHRVSLLLHLLLLFLLAMAVAEPLVPGWNTPEKRWAFVIDTSPPMMARDGEGRTRLERARARAREWLAGVAEVSLFDGAGLVEPATRDHDRIRASLGRVEIQRRGDAAAVIRSIRAAQPGIEVVLFTGRTAAPLENRGWVEGSWRWPPGSAAPLLELRARRFGGAGSVERVVLRWNGNLLAEKRIELEEEALFQVRLDPKAFPGHALELGGVVEAGFLPEDAFPLDDVATFVLPPSTPTPVVVFHPDRPDPRLMEALKALAGDGLVAEPSPVSIDRFGEASPALREGVAVIFDRCAPPVPLSRGAVLRFGAGSGPVIERPGIRDWDTKGPLLRGIDLTDLAVRRARVLKEGAMLIESSAGPIAVQERRGGWCRVVFGFPLSLSESDLTLRAAFPLFLRKWVEWIRLGGATRSFPRQVDWADPVSPSAPLWTDAAELRAEERSGKRDFRIPSQAIAPGPLRVSGADRGEWIGVNAFHPEWSDLSGEDSPLPPVPRRPWYRDLSLPVAAACLALLLLLAEWFLHHRGWI